MGSVKTELAFPEYWLGVRPCVPHLTSTTHDAHDNAVCERHKPPSTAGGQTKAARLCLPRRGPRQRPPPRDRPVYVERAEAPELSGGDDEQRVQHLLCVGPSSEYVPCVNSFDPQHGLRSRPQQYLHFADREYN